MYSNNILTFQESTTILNACTEKYGNLLKAPRISPKVYVIAQLEFELAYNWFKSWIISILKKNKW